MGKKEVTIKVEPKPFDKLMAGLNKAAEPVISTFGPCGKNVLIDRGGFMYSTRDGVTVARAIRLKDRLENMGAMAVKEAASHTNGVAGDGTTVTTILVRKILEEGAKYVAAGHNPMHIQRSIEESVNNITKELKESAKQVSTLEDITSVATISANNDKSLGELIAGAIHKVGEDGNVLVENSINGKTELKFQDGVVVDRGLSDSSMHFADMGSRNATFDKALVAIVDQPVSLFENLIPILNYCHQNKQPLLLALRDCEPTVLQVLLRNKLQNGMKIAVIATPGLGNYEIVEDFASVVGATPYHRDYNPLDSNSFNPSHLGFVERVVVGKHSTTFIGGNGNIAARVQTLQKAKEVEEEDGSKKKLQDRINKLTNSIAILSVSAETETEMQDKKFRIEDAINASRAAVSEGIVPGGGIALYRASRKVSETIGNQILRIAMGEPVRQLARNAGENAELIVAQLDNKEYEFGFDANKKEIANMYERGVLDPVKVIKTALQKAASTAGVMLTVGSCLVREDNV